MPITCSCICLRVSNTNQTCYDLSVDAPTRLTSMSTIPWSKPLLQEARWVSLGTVHWSKPLLQEAFLWLSADGCFATNEHNIHCSQCHRTVSGHDAENYMICLDRDANRQVFHNFGCKVKDSINDSKEISNQRQLCGFATGFFSTLLSPMINNKLEGFRAGPICRCIIKGNIILFSATVLLPIIIKVLRDLSI